MNKNIERRKNSITGLIVVLALLGALIGGLITFVAFSRIEVDDTKATALTIVNNQLHQQISALESDLELAKATAQSTNTIVKEIDVTREIPMDIRTTYLNPAITEVINYLDDEDELECGGDDYNVDEVTVSRTYNDFKVEYSDTDEYTVSGEIKLNFKQSDEKRCREDVKFSVFYELDENPAITIENITVF